MEKYKKTQFLAAHKQGKLAILANVLGSKETVEKMLQGVVEQGKDLTDYATPTTLRGHGHISDKEHQVYTSRVGDDLIVYLEYITDKYTHTTAYLVI
jgi:hypothetical protein